MTTSIALVLFVSSMRQFIEVFGPFILVILKYLFDIRVYTHFDQVMNNSIMNHVKTQFFCNSDDDGNPVGWIFDKNMQYICYISSFRRNDKEVNIFCSSRTHNRLIKPQVELKQDIVTDKDVPIKNNNLTVLFRKGDYDYVTYQVRTLPFNHEMTAKQEQIAEDIMREYHEHNRCCSYIYGAVGTGKTMLAYLLSKKMGGSLCDTFNPTEPNDFFENLYTTRNPTKTKPLIVLLDEADKMIQHIHDETIAPHKKYPIMVYNKATWNLFFDRIDMGVYPYTIVILCSNVSPKEMNRLDTCYLREKRIHSIHQLTR